MAEARKAPAKTAADTEQQTAVTPAATSSVAASPEPTAPAATVRTQEYAAGTGWEVGQTAPEDAFRALGGEGMTTPVGPVVHEHPGGYARQIVAKGGLVTEGVRRELDAADESDDADDSEQG